VALDPPCPPRGRDPTGRSGLRLCAWICDCVSFAVWFATVWCSFHRSSPCHGTPHARARRPNFHKYSHFEISFSLFTTFHRTHDTFETVTLPRSRDPIPIHPRPSVINTGRCGEATESFSHSTQCTRQAARASLSAHTRPQTLPPTHAPPSASAHPILSVPGWGARTRQRLCA